MRRGRVPELGVILLVFQIVKNIGVTNIPPVTFIAILIQVAVYLQFLVVPRLCLSGEAVWNNGDYLKLIVPVIRHSHDIHLYYNMVSLAWKGLTLEKRLGSVRFLITLGVLTVMSSVGYVLLAVLASDLLEDYSYMRQCAVGFSGVLFALKVLNSHYSSTHTEESYFGFLVPMKYAVWFELVIIQVMVPNASFLGHLGGILAGVVFVKGPIGGLLSLARAPSIITISPGCLLLTGGLMAGHLGLMGQPPFKGCLPTRQLLLRSWQKLSLPILKDLFMSPLYHLGSAHLGVNLISFLIKGRRLEKSLGLPRFLATTLLSGIGTTAIFWVVNRLVYEASGNADHIHPCVVGLSGPLFALKVLVFLHTDRFDKTLMFELVELIVLLEKNHRLYHLSGMLTGLIIYFCFLPRSSPWSSSGGRRLGGDGNHWTRSWGYGQYPQPGNSGYSGHSEMGDGMSSFDSNQQEADMEEALRRSRESYFQEFEVHQDGDHEPSAPTYEDIVGPRPPLYPHNPGPPPQGGWRMPPSREPTVDELRQRRLERFS